MEPKHREALIVEDDRVDQQTVRGILEARSFHCDIVDSALAARSRLKDRHYDMVFLDLDLGAGIDEGRFLLDTMQKEAIAKPTVIISLSALQFEIVTLKAKYKFVKEFIDKKHLSSFLDVLDNAIAEVFRHDKDHNQHRSPISQSLLGNLFAFLIVFLIVIGGVSVASSLVSPVQFALILIASVLIFLAIGALALKSTEQLTEKTFFEIILLIIKSLPLLKSTGRQQKKRPQ